MAEKHDEFKVHLLSFTDEELDTIICALYEVGDDDLADEIDGLISDDCECCGTSGVVALDLDFDLPPVQYTEDRPTISHECDTDGFKANIATLTIDIDTSATQEKVDKLLKSANEACDALDRLRGASNGRS